ncbi:LOW QUALITY PROTEIN: serum amyloid A protein, partial [Salvelinus sp. IW2-2015]|uniref:LOW QUALITY PROTEIN: serum amyloid A protein n=1 Tax=Salvelinus sp. IW2-2015 TaxID=2691554 RepID=UPI000CEAC08C
MKLLLAGLVLTFCGLKLSGRQTGKKNSDKYFHARGNYDAARRGAPGAVRPGEGSGFMARHETQQLTSRLLRWG